MTARLSDIDDRRVRPGEPAPPVPGPEPGAWHEVARRVGLRQPSLYQYFDSRTAVYDALFERGMRAHYDTVAAAPPGWAAVRAAMSTTLRFTADYPVLAQFLFTRAVPGFTSSERAYAPSLRLYGLIRDTVAAAVEHGDLPPAADTDDGVALLVAITAGIASQQAANDPGASGGSGM